MNRPVYETKESLKNEVAVQKIIEHYWKCKLEKLPIKNIVDFAATRQGKIVGWIEVRCRTNPRLQYDTYLLSLAKYKFMCEYHALTNIPSFLVVQWSDDLGFVDITKANPSYAMGGCYHRNDDQDHEPIAYIPIDQFTLFKS